MEKLTKRNPATATTRKSPGQICISPAEKNSENKTKRGRSHTKQKKHTIPWGLPPFFPSNARWLSPGRLPSRKDNCILQIHRIKAVATSIMTTMCLPKRIVDLCVSSLRRGHANLLCIVPILSDVFFPSDASWLPPGRSTCPIVCCRDK